MTASRRIMVGNVGLSVLDAGAGPPVLLVHGLPDDHQVWRKQVPALVAAGYRVIAPDTRGCGQSDVPAAVSDYALPRLVGDLVALLDELGIDRVRLVGHDWGAVIGWALCLAHPERIERYAALSVGHPTAYARGGARQKLKGYYVWLFQLRGVTEWLLRARSWWLTRKMGGNPDEAERWIANLSRSGRLTAVLNYYRANFSILWPRELPKAQMPVLGLFGDGDRFLTEAQIRDSAQYVSGSFRFERVEGVGHWLQLEAPDAVNALLIEFLGEEVRA
jgi:pimeloyl-ACP methyl ester carboxylesterase